MLALRLVWIGYHLDARSWTIGIHASRAEAMVQEGCAMIRVRATDAGAFHSLLGKLGFACNVLSGLKHILQPLFASLRVLPARGAGTAAQERDMYIADAAPRSAVEPYSPRAPDRRPRAGGSRVRRNRRPRGIHRGV